MLTVALTTGLLTAAAPTAHAAAGATLPFTSVEAESATTTGTRIGPDHTQGTLASEASGRQAVRLTAGQRVEFTVPRAANAVNLAYSVPDGQSGTLNVYVNGTRLARTLPVTSKYSYIDTSWIPGARTHHFFDNARLLLGQNVQAGDKVAFESTGTQVTADVADFEQVAGAAGQPAGSVSVTSRGADPTGNGDSTQAFRDAISAAQGGVVWIPPGDYRLTSSLNGIQNVTLQGAGSWHSVVHTSRFIDQSGSAGGVRIKDFAVIGEVTERVDSNPDNFVNGSLGPGSSVSGMWLQHLKVGLWLTGNNDNLVVENNRFLDMTADGLNLNGNARGVRVRHNFLRNQGDDALAMWSLYAPDTNSSFENNTITQPNLANGIAIYGGTDDRGQEQPGLRHQRPRQRHRDLQPEVPSTAPSAALAGDMRTADAQHPRRAPARGPELDAVGAGGLQHHRVDRADALDRVEQDRPDAAARDDRDLHGVADAREQGHR